ncbi:RNA recognition motif-containing protein [Spironucleus salmonicida]|uniref:RNA recognition motif-containing protein n=1 Tax=Spironucleus salmonicida TaxID=348837 RepID=V6LDN6_9EUKA|nr:RNA recognition motif-containing protein [Spironucleus salmonicida]|eukprot:EST42625.1 RNA recognition motif-containing protein [Spironucleus salmonicida]
MFDSVETDFAPFPFARSQNSRFNADFTALNTYYEQFGTQNSASPPLCLPPGLVAPPAPRPDESRQFQLYIGSLPPNTTNQDLEVAFSPFGDLENVFVQAPKCFGFVNFKERDALVRACHQRKILVRGRAVQLSGYHKKLTLILSNVAEFIQEEAFQGLIDRYLTGDIFCYVQFVYPNSKFFVYLHFISEAESNSALKQLQGTSFGKFLQDVYPGISFPQIFVKRFITKEIRETQHQHAKVTTQVGIYVSELPMDVSDSSIRTNFQVFGTVSSLSILNTRQNLNQSPCAIVYFSDDMAGEAAIREGQMNFDGQLVTIKRHIKKQMYK